MENEKLILDACCGNRAMWYDKNHKKTIYMDIREEEKGFSKYEPNLEIKPTELGDFRNLRYKNSTFKLVVWDPPHKKHRNSKGVLDLRYGNLSKKDWENDLRKGFRELWRVLDDYGILVFKWGSAEINLSEVIKLFNVKPLFGTKTGIKGNTTWACFMKFPKERTDHYCSGYCAICGTMEL